MKQALRIFRKDFDYLRIEVAVFLLLCAVFVWMSQWSEELLELAAVWLVARAVHADAVPGDRQFWLTRPYSRRGLIAAKLLFVAVCISLPIAVAELTIALKSGFSLKEAIPTLLLSQTLLFVFGGLPVLGLAALTSGMIPFFLTALGLALVFLGGTAMLEMRFPGYLDSMPGPSNGFARSFLRSRLRRSRPWSSFACTDRGRSVPAAPLRLAGSVWLPCCSFLSPHRWP